MDVHARAELTWVGFGAVQVGDRDDVRQLTALDVGEQEAIAVVGAGHIRDRVVDHEAVRLFNLEDFRVGAPVFVREREGVNAAGQVVLVVVYAALEVDLDANLRYLEGHRTGSTGGGGGKTGVAVARAADLRVRHVEEQLLWTGNGDGRVRRASGLVRDRNHVFPIASEAGKRTEAISGIRLEDEAEVVGGEGRQTARSTGGGEADGGDVLIPAEVVLRQFSSQLDFLG